MKKRWLLLMAVVACVSVAGYFWWPISFDSYFADPTQVFAVHTVFSVDYDTPVIDTTRYEIEPGGEEYIRLEELMGKYTYHRCLATLWNQGTMYDMEEEITIWFAYTRDGVPAIHRVTLWDDRAQIWAEGEDGKLVTYRVGYLGNGKAAELYEYLKEMIVTWEPEE